MGDNSVRAFRVWALCAQVAIKSHIAKSNDQIADLKICGRPVQSTGNEQPLPLHLALQLNTKTGKAILKLDPVKSRLENLPRAADPVANGHITQIKRWHDERIFIPGITFTRSACLYIPVGSTIRMAFEQKRDPLCAHTRYLNLTGKSIHDRKTNAEFRRTHHLRLRAPGDIAEPNILRHDCG